MEELLNFGLPYQSRVLSYTPMKNTYLPSSESDQVKWMNNFVAKLAVHSATVGVTAAELAALQADAAYLSYLLHDLLPLYRAKAHEITAYKDLMKSGPLGTPAGTLPVAPTPPTPPTAVQPGVMPRIAALVQRIKNAPGYNVALGADMGIEAPTATPILAASVKPTFTATAAPGYQVQLDWVKGKLDGVRVECKRATEADWVPLGDDRYSPYTDARPALQPGSSEIRSYRMRYYKKDELVGTYSDTVTVLATP
jgi:hypothetical protein